MSGPQRVEVPNNPAAFTATVVGGRVFAALRFDAWHRAPEDREAMASWYMMECVKGQWQVAFPMYAYCGLHDGEAQKAAVERMIAEPSLILDHLSRDDEKWRQISYRESAKAASRPAALPKARKRSIDPSKESNNPSREFPQPRMPKLNQNLGKAGDLATLAAEELQRQQAKAWDDDVAGLMADRDDADMKSERLHDNDDLQEPGERIGD